MSKAVEIQNPKNIIVSLTAMRRIRKITRQYRKHTFIILGKKGWHCFRRMVIVEHMLTAFPGYAQRVAVCTKCGKVSVLPHVGKLSSL